VGNEDESNRKIENKAEAIAKKTKFELENGYRKQNHFDFQGGILKYHQWITLIFGITLVSLALLHQRGSFLYFYLFGLIKIGKDTLQTFLDMNEAKLSPLIYYLFGGLVSAVVIMQIGYPIPDMTYGLIYNTNEVLP